MQLENTIKENKNSIVFGYLSMLVERGIFKKIKVNFLLVGHTHDHIDQMFSRFSKKLVRCDAFTLLALSMLIIDAYTQSQKYNIWMKFMILNASTWMVIGLYVGFLHRLII